MARITPVGKFTIILLIAAVLFGIYSYSKKNGLIDKLAPKGKFQDSKLTDDVKKLVDNGTDIVRVGVVTWGGYAGGQYFNNGFNPSAQSRYFTEYGILAQFKVLDDFDASRNAWKSGDIDLLWVTADAYPTEVNGLAEYNPKFLFQADWSRGGDAIVVTRGINTVNDLPGKKVACALGTPSHTFLIKSLQAAGIDYNKVEVVKVASAINAAELFKSGKVDAAVVWSPDDDICIQTVPGSKVLVNTKEATHIIADGFFAKQEYVEKHRETLKKFVEGFLKGAAEINSSPEAKAKAVDILVAGLGVEKNFAENAINNVRLCTYGDNLNFFGLQTTNGIKGEDLYRQMSNAYTALSLAPASVTPWRQVIDTSILTSLNMKAEGANAAEGDFKFDKVANQANLTTKSSKALSVTFPSGSSTLDDNAKQLIDMGFAETAKQFASMRIKVIGHTDNIGNRDGNVRLSKARANAVAYYLINQYKLDKNRFIIEGKGPDEPVADNNSDENRSKNRRTVFELLQ